eukprot:evm.model.NODE_35244_length_30808_cov_23.771132.5
MRTLTRKYTNSMRPAYLLEGVIRTATASTVAAAFGRRLGERKKEQEQRQESPGDRETLP